MVVKLCVTICTYSALKHNVEISQFQKLIPNAFLPFVYNILKTHNLFADTASAVAASVTPLLHSVHPLSTSSTPIHTPASTPVPSSVQNPNGTTVTSAQPPPPLPPLPPQSLTTQSSSSSVVANTLLPPSLQNVEAFSSFLGEEIVSNWRRGLELPPPTAGVATLRTSMQSMQLNHQISSPTADDHLLSHRHHDDKSSSHHDASSTASTPVLQDARSEENFNGSGCGGHTPMSLKRSKSPEDNNNHLGSLPHGPASFPMGLPFQFQDRGHFRFAEDMQMAPGTMAGRLGDSLIPKGDPMEAKLQEMLRYNMDKYANQNLDTLHISRRVRELLSVHNIGQRLFAKYVLGLSQGTVSELLSKPKPWDKLTEKGRDSYRKMHAWSCDDNAVLLLKSLIPKKGKCFCTIRSCSIPFIMHIHTFQIKFLTFYNLNPNAMSATARSTYPNHHITLQPVLSSVSLLFIRN